MTITLRPEQENWLKAQVASGEFASVEEAVLSLIDDRMAGDELDWAKALVAEGVAALDRGEFIELDEHKRRNAARLAALQR